MRFRSISVRFIPYIYVQECWLNCKRVPISFISVDAAAHEIPVCQNRTRRSKLHRKLFGGQKLRQRVVSMFFYTLWRTCMFFVTRNQPLYGPITSTREVFIIIIFVYIFYYYFLFFGWFVQKYVDRIFTNVAYEKYLSSNTRIKKK